jgi:hypothetical protein
MLDQFRAPLVVEARRKPSQQINRPIGRSQKQPSRIPTLPIRHRIRLPQSELKTQSWNPDSSIDVAVRNGVVRFSGTIMTRGSAKRYGLPLKTFVASRRSRTPSFWCLFLPLICRRRSSPRLREYFACCSRLPINCSTANCDHWSGDDRTQADQRVDADLHG